MGFDSVLLIRRPKVPPWFILLVIIPLEIVDRPPWMVASLLGRSRWHVRRLIHDSEEAASVAPLGRHQRSLSTTPLSYSQFANFQLL